MSQPDRPDPTELLEQSQSTAEGLIEFQPGDSLLHRLNPVTKLVVVVCLAVVVFVWPSWEVPLALTGVFLLVAATGGVFPQAAKILAVIGVPIIGLLLPVQGLFYPQNQTPLYVLGGVPVVDTVTVFREGVDFALLISFRLTALIVAMTATVLTTHPKKLTDSLMQRGMSHKFAYVFIAALQFVPQMSQRSNQILAAQRARGLDTQANLIRRLRAVVELLSPLLISTLISTQTRALALESRGFTRTGSRTFLYDIPDTRVDRAIRWSTATVAAAALVWVVVL